MRKRQKPKEYEYAYEVWRGLSVDRPAELDISKLVMGDRLSPRRHRWWTHKRGIAEAYATTGKGVPVLIKAVVQTDREFPTPCLPELLSDERVTVIEVLFL